MFLALGLGRWQSDLAAQGSRFFGKLFCLHFERLQLFFGFEDVESVAATIALGLVLVFVG